MRRLEHLPPLRADELRKKGPEAAATALLDRMNEQQGVLESALAKGYETKTLTIRVPQVAWRTPTMTNSWVVYDANYDSPQYRIDETGRVLLKGMIKSGSRDTAAFTLPAGYRPAKIKTFPVISNNALGRIDIETDGDVIAAKDLIGSNTWLSLEGVGFFATNPAPPDAWSGSGWPLAVQTSLNVPVSGVVVWRAADLSDGRVVAHGSPGVVWEQAGRGISIRSLPGLSPGRLYRVTLVIHGQE